MKKLNETQRAIIAEGLLDYVWKMYMGGKMATLRKTFLQGDPSVRKDLADVEDSLDKLRASIAKAKLDRE